MENASAYDRDKWISIVGEILWDQQSKIKIYSKFTVNKKVTKAIILYKIMLKRNNIETIKIYISINYTFNNFFVCTLSWNFNTIEI